MQIRQTQKLTQKLILTPQMKQSLHILQLQIIELKDYVEKEIEENPVLESQTDKKEESLPEKSTLDETTADIMYHDHPLGDYPDELNKKKDYKQSLITKPITLHEILLKQLRMSKLNKKLYQIAELIIHNIDDNGYLTLSLDETINFLNKEKKEAADMITLREAELTLALIHGFEPIGVGARNLKECLLIQLKAKGKTNTLAYKIVQSHLSDVAKSRIRIIAKKLKVKPAKIKETIKIISRLEPKPGRLYSYSSPTVATISSYPDIIIERNQSDFRI